MHKSNTVKTVCLLSKLHVEHHVEGELGLEDELDLAAVEKKAACQEMKDHVPEHLTSCSRNGAALLW